MSNYVELPVEEIELDIEAAEEFFKLIKVHHVAVRVVHLIEELEKFM